jgi:hypothetical protein
VPVTVRGHYLPLTGDFDGDGARDVLWYQPGAGADVAWFGQGNGRFRARRVDAPDGAEPFTGDFDGDGRRDVFWYGPGGAGDRLWYGGAGGRFATAAATVNGSYQPLVADFGGDGPDDVLWWAAGPAGDVLWFGRGTRRFTSRWTTADLDYQRAAAVRPEALASGYDPYGFVAHAMGSVSGLLYSNSLEAFQRNLGRGFRVFECDNVLLADGTALVAHDGLEANYGLDKPFRDATWPELAGRRTGASSPSCAARRCSSCWPTTRVSTSSPTPSTPVPRSTGPMSARRRPWAGSTCWSGSCPMSPTRPSWTPCEPTTRCATTCSRSTTPRPTTGWTTPRWSTSSAATGSRR